MIMKIYLFALLLFISPSFAEVLKLAVGLALPPYFIENEDRGLELDIIRAAFANSDYQIQPQYMPFARVLDSFQGQFVDAAATINPASGINDGYYSQSHVRYQNVAVTLAKSGIVLSELRDLTQYSVLAFQNATKYLGSEFAQTAAETANYSEKAKQELQVSWLTGERVEVIVLDINIFYYYYQHLAKQQQLPVTIHYLFAPVDYQVLFHDQKAQQAFDDGLTRLQQNGEYQQILERYQSME